MKMSALILSTPKKFYRTAIIINDIVVGLGVAISGANYEVGDEVVKALIATGIAERYESSGKYHVDLRVTNSYLLQ